MMVMLSGTLFWKEMLSQVSSTRDKRTAVCHLQRSCAHTLLHSGLSLGSLHHRTETSQGDPGRAWVHRPGNNRLQSQVSTLHTPRGTPCSALPWRTAGGQGPHWPHYGTRHPAQSVVTSVHLSFGFLPTPIAIPQVLEPTAVILPLTSTCTYTLCSFRLWKNTLFTGLQFCSVLVLLSQWRGSFTWVTPVLCFRWLEVKFVDLNLDHLHPAIVTRFSWCKNHTPRNTAWQGITSKLSLSFKVPQNLAYHTCPTLIQ